MSYIIGLLALVLGFLMDFFFKGLTFVGYPRLWACIVLYAVATRFFFLPQRINNYKKKLLMPVINRELLSYNPHFFEKTKDPQLVLERNKLKKQHCKKYGVSNRSGFVMTLIQYPFLIALFYVVKHPEDFIPSLEALSSVSANVNTFLGLSLAAIPLNSLQNADTSMLILCVPAVVVLSNVLKMIRTLKLAKTTAQKIKVYALCGLFTLLLGWFSASLPLAISIYWIANDITYYIFDLFIHKYVPKSPVVVAALKDHKERLRQIREEKEAAASAAAEQTEEWEEDASSDENSRSDEDLSSAADACTDEEKTSEITAPSVDARDVATAR